MTSGGWSDTELNELAVKPTKPCGARAVMTVTPVGNCANASRKCLSATAGRGLRLIVGMVWYRGACDAAAAAPHLRQPPAELSKRLRGRPKGC